MPYQPTDPVTDIAEIRAVHPEIHPAQERKILDHLDAHCQAWIARSPFVIVATYDRAGRVDCSPKGDPAGFVRVLDDQTLALPDRPGNHRFDSYENILATGAIGLIFLVPNRNEVVRVNGTARIVRDAPLRASMAIKGRVPAFALLVSVQEAFFHCGKAIIRSGLWHPDKAASTAGLPSYAEALHDQTETGLGFDEIAARLAHNEANRLYDE